MSATTKQKPLVPELRFSGFDGGWQEIKLDDCISDTVDNRGKTPPVSTEGIPMIEVNAIGNKNIDYKKITKFVTKNTYDTWFRNYLKPQDVLFSTVGATAQCSIYDGKTTSVVAQNIVGLRFSEVDSVFGFYLLVEPSNNHKFKKIQMNGVQPSVKVSQMIHLCFAVPELPEQQKIADFIGSVDAWLDNLRGQKTALQSYKQGMMQKLFSGQVRFKDEEGRNFPELEEKKLGQTSQIVGGGTPDTTISTYWGGTISWYTPTEIKTGNPSASLRTITTAGLNNSSAKVLPIGTILLTTRATIGDVAILEAEAATNQGFQSLIVNEHNHNYFLYFWLQHHKNELSKKANGSTFLEVSSKEIAKIAISLPTKQEQQKIADFLTALDQTITTKAEEITKVEEWKKGLMQKMFV